MQKTFFIPKKLIDEHGIPHPRNAGLDKTVIPKLIQRGQLSMEQIFNALDKPMRQVTVKQFLFFRDGKWKLTPSKTLAPQQKMLVNNKMPLYLAISNGYLSIGELIQSDKITLQEVDNFFQQEV